jgi:hypothetical protein
VFEVGRADFMPPPDAAKLPRSLLDSFVGSASERVDGRERSRAGQHP